MLIPFKVKREDERSSTVDGARACAVAAIVT